MVLASTHVTTDHSMASLQQQLAHLVNDLETLQTSIPVDTQTKGVTLEQHAPGNGHVYPRLRAPKGKTLANGKRTMSLSLEEAENWAQKIDDRNQQAKVTQCLSLIQQATEIAEEIVWEIDEEEKDKKLVKEEDAFTLAQAKDIPPSTGNRKPKTTINYVLKDAKGATTFNRIVHAIAEAEPTYGRWHSPALCGERPKPGSWGWRLCDPSTLSCPKCHAQVKLFT